MKITAYHGNYHKYGTAFVNTNAEAEKAVNRFYNDRRIRWNGTVLYKIDDSEFLTYSEARVFLGYPAR